MMVPFRGVARRHGDVALAVGRDGGAGRARHGDGGQHEHVLQPPVPLQLQHLRDATRDVTWWHGAVTRGTSTSMSFFREVDLIV